MSTFRHTIQTLITVFATITCSSGAAAATPYPELDSVICALMRRYELPAASIALMRDDRIIYTAAYGVTDTLRHTPTTIRTRFRIASLSKPVTMAGILLLAAQGRLSLDDRVFGEGAILVTRDGKPFMENYDPRGSLAPRDIVARAIDNEMKKRGDPYCCLDIRHKGEAYLKERFPAIYAKCLEFGIDMARDLIPIVPAAHYLCGGIAADVEGRTTLPGLYAIGECACTGLHGANRLASNSLLEALVCGCTCADALCAQPVPSVAHVTIPDWVYGHAVPTDEAVLVAHNWQELRTCMWDYVGIVRTDKRLRRALRRVRNLREEINEYYFDYLVTADILELRNIADVAELIITSAMARRESRGLHYTLDCPDRLRLAKDTDLVRAPEKEW